MPPFIDNRAILRRDLVRVGAQGARGLGLPELLRAESIDNPAPSSAVPRGRAKACILFFLEGGPAHQDLWDMKPEAPAEVRGEFAPIASTLSGAQVCEHLPLLAKQMHHVALVQSV